MPLHRSARLFTLGVALAGSCAAQTTLEDKQSRSPQAPLRQQQKLGKAQLQSQIKANQTARKVLYDRQQRRATPQPRTLPGLGPVG